MGVEVKAAKAVAVHPTSMGDQAGIMMNHDRFIVGRAILTLNLEESIRNLVFSCNNKAMEAKNGRFSVVPILQDLTVVETKREMQV